MFEDVKNLDSFKEFLTLHLACIRNEDYAENTDINELISKIKAEGSGILKTEKAFSPIEIEPIDFDNIEKYRALDMFPALLHICATYLHVFDASLVFPMTFENQLESKNFMTEQLSRYAAHEVFGDTAKQLLQMINW